MVDATTRWLTATTLRLLIILKPASIDPRSVRPGHIAAAALLFAAVLTGIDAVLAESPRTIEPWGLLSLLGALSVVGIASAGVALLRQRPALLRPVAAILFLSLSVQAPLLLALTLVLQPGSWVPAALQGAWILLVLWRLLDGVDPHARHWRHTASTLAGSAVTILAVAVLPRWPLVDSQWLQEWDEAPQWTPLTHFDAEALIYDQRARIDSALETLTPQRPGVPDLYFVAFGADGSERVFAEEADYAARLVGQRLGAEGRTMVLGNDLRTPAERPLATLTNLRLALQGIGRIMDPDEDILFLFLTTHGRESHQLYVHLPPLPLNQIDPADLREALDASGIRWRVLLVSACYSGGFIETLSDANTLVMTATRADRSSFGCGPDSDITWFGRAYFAEALNRTTDLVAAFHIARKLIATWEKDEDVTASHPQIHSTPLIGARLQAWAASFEPGPTLIFEPPGHDGTSEGSKGSGH
ncbi:MAG TPA: C13 family peptidase [Xanthomonadaceae bacterium]|nr:C13 family peptidase [Xanthomonadaceae bacterium]